VNSTHHLARHQQNRSSSLDQDHIHLLGLVDMGYSPSEILFPRLHRLEKSEVVPHGWPRIDTALHWRPS
jgi:hypothetical protein